MTRSWRVHAPLLVLSLGLTLTLGRMDHEAGSLLDVFRWQNVPAIVLYTFFFHAILLFVRASIRALMAPIAPTPDGAADDGATGAGATTELATEGRTTTRGD